MTEGAGPLLRLRLVHTATQTGRPDDVLDALGLDPVSYTHLDVYKRQKLNWPYSPGVTMAPAPRSAVVAAGVACVTQPCLLYTSRCV